MKLLFNLLSLCIFASASGQSEDTSFTWNISFKGKSNIRQSMINGRIQKDTFNVLYDRSPVLTTTLEFLREFTVDTLVFMYGDYTTKSFNARCYLEIRNDSGELLTIASTSHESYSIIRDEPPYEMYDTIIGGAEEIMLSCYHLQNDPWLKISPYLTLYFYGDGSKSKIKICTLSFSPADNKK